MHGAVLSGVNSILDMGPENVGEGKFGVVVLDAEEVLRWCDSNACYGYDGC